MKLKTEMSSKPWLDGRFSPVGHLGDKNHDAAAAHALMRAIKEIEDGPCIPTLDAIYEQAEEIMREFGYEVE